MDSQHKFDFKSLLQSLEKGSQATITLPEDSDYNELNTRFSNRGILPAGAIFFPRTVEDVSSAIKFVSEHKIDLAVVCGGHSASRASSTDGGLVIDLRHMRSVKVDPEKKTVTAGGGCLWKDVDDAAAEYGLAVVGGTVNHTGIGGLTLGGGYGYLTGTHGLTIDNLLSVEVVLASGEIVTASEKENKELFWAIRGAGQNFGVVTTFVYQARDQKNNVFIGLVAFPATLTVITGITDFVNDYFGSERDDGNATVMFGIGAVPPDFKKMSVIAVIFYNGSEEKGKEFYKPIFDLNPVMNMTKEVSYKMCNQILADLATHGDRMLNKGGIYQVPLKVETVMETMSSLEELLKKFPDDPAIGKSKVLFEFQSNKVLSSLSNGCFANRGDIYNASILMRWSDTNNDDEVEKWARRTGREITIKNGGMGKDNRIPEYGNYDDTKTPPSYIFGDSYERLKELKAKYDPKNLFNKWHSLVPQ